MARRSLVIRFPTLTTSEGLGQLAGCRVSRAVGASACISGKIGGNSMSDHLRLSRLVGIVLSSKQRYACEFLELRGLRFCVDFGYENCEQMAADLFVRGLGA